MQNQPTNATQPFIANEKYDKINQVKDSLTNNPNIKLLIEESNRDILGSSTLEELFVNLGVMTLDLFRNPFFSSQKKFELFVDLERFYLQLGSQNFDSPFLQPYFIHFLQSINYYATQPSFSIEAATNPFCFASCLSNKMDLNSKRKILQKKISDASQEQLDLITSVILAETEDWDFNLNVNTFSNHLVEYLLDKLDDPFFSIE
ncbi:Uncharacterized protein QTN25_007866 [Entamoeba marina]